MRILLVLSACCLAIHTTVRAAPEGVKAGLLDRFRPAIYLVGDGPGGARVDYPSSYVADDGEIENNFETPDQAGGTLCYGLVHEELDANQRACWVMEYHYYYPRNWADNSPPFGCFTHEHDWEWIYVVAGFDQGDYRPYCACFSGHAESNRDLFEREGAVRLFPGVAGGSVWKEDWDAHPDDAPRVSLDQGERPEATSLDTGNAFDGAPWQPRSPECWRDYPIVTFEPLSSACSDTTRFFYGDPELPLLCIGRSGRGECDDPRDPPWMRAGLGSNGPLPADFALPADWVDNPSTEAARGAGRAMVRLLPNPAFGKVYVDVGSGRAPAAIGIFDAAGRFVRSCVLGSGARGAGSGWIDLHGLAAGFYWARVRWPDQEGEVRRVLILH